MKISQEFVVGRSPDTVWNFFQDIPSVARCLPGAELAGMDENGAYQGQLTAKLGPMTAAFDGTATVSADPATRSARIEGRGVDRKGGSRGQVAVDYRVTPEGDGTRVGVDADITLSGPAAQFGRTGLINEMSRRLIDEFVACLEASLAATTPEEAAAVSAPEVKGFRLFFAALWASIKKLFRKG